MKYLLDTNICIYIIKKKPPEVIRRFKVHKPGDLYVSVITISELQYGIEKSSRPGENAIALKEFLQPLEILEYTTQDSEAYGRIRFDLELKGRPVGAMDLLIASQAVSKSMILVTNNEKEFKKIKNLKVENWT